MKHFVNRRKFASTSLQSAALLAVGTAAPNGWMTSLAASLTQQPRNQEKVLVVIQLSGGNDGLNTVIPYENELYYKSRPKLAIPKRDVISLDAQVGLHPSMRGISTLLDERKFMVIQGVGYSNPNRSHFESMDIWHSCHRKESRSTEGWLGRYFAKCNQTNNLESSDSAGLHLGSEQLPMALVARGVQTPSLASIDQLRWKGSSISNLPTEENGAMQRPPALDKAENSLLDFVSASTSVAMKASERLEKALASPDKSGDFPNSQLGDKLKVISRLLLAGMKTRVYYVTLDGFDTHANQPVAHAALIRQWSDALHAFHTRMDQAGLGDNVLVFSFSEFGRRVSENASQGTDHGAAAPVFLSGSNLKQPLIGVHPSLSDLDDGDMKFHTDFRRIYATLIEDWLGVSSQEILGVDYTKLAELGLQS